MRPKTILVCLTTPDHADVLLKFAVPLARKHRAHLIGLHTIEALSVYPGIAMHVPGPAFEHFNESQQRDADAIRVIYDKHLGPELVPNEFRLLRTEAVSASTRMVESARAADLVIMAQEDAAVDRADQHNVQEWVIRESGRPVIVVPHGYDGPEIGENFLLGWSDTSEAARAAHDMVTLANEGASVTVLRVGHSTGDGLRDSRGIDLVETLSRHGLKPSLAHRDLSGSNVADVLETAAFESGASLIVIGAFGHSKLYDMLIGATSRTLLQSAKLPVLFST